MFLIDKIAFYTETNRNNNNKYIYMKLIITRENILITLKAVIGVVERRQAAPITSHILFSKENNEYKFTASDMEAQLVAKLQPDSIEEFSGSITFPGKKLYDICNGLPAKSEITITDTGGGKVTLSSNKSRFVLSTLDASTFPLIDVEEEALDFNVSKDTIKKIIDRTAFAMAQQDVRYYLNGLYFLITPKEICGVATDGHRLAKAEAAQDISIAEPKNAIIPRKGVLEIQKITENETDQLKGRLTKNYLRLSAGDVEITTKLIEGKFPDYDKVIPADCDKSVKVNAQKLKDSLNTVAVLSNDRFRGVRLNCSNNVIQISAHNPEKEEAQDEVPCEYSGEQIEVGFNVSYFLDVLSVIKTENAQIHFKDSNSSALITPENDDSASYVIMPMRL